MDIFLPNKYTKIYYNIIFSAKTRKVIKGRYYEKHHIIPRSIGGLNVSSNLVKLTAKEHFICHRLLVKMTEGKFKSKMACAIFRLSKRSKYHLESPKITSRVYQTIKKDFSSAMSNLRAGKKPYEMTDEVRKNMSIAARKRAPRKQSDEERERRRGSKNGRALTWNLERQDGSLESVESLKTWCFERGINYTSLLHTQKSKKFYKDYRIHGVFGRK